MIELKEVLKEIVSPIVSQPEKVIIIEEASGRDVLLKLNVAPEDMGKVIGRHGKIAKAIRTVMKAAATAANLHVRVDILDYDELNETAPASDEE